MSLRPEYIGPVPNETARIAKKVFRKGNLCLRLRCCNLWRISRIDRLLKRCEDGSIGSMCWAWN